jgi:hypothetical protein
MPVTAFIPRSTYGGIRSVRESLVMIFFLHRNHAASVIHSSSAAKTVAQKPAGTLGYLLSIA